MTAVPLTSPTSASAEPPFLPPAGDFCQQRQKSPKTPLETAFQDFLTRVGYDFALTCPTRNRFSGFFRFKGSCLHSFPRCAVARRCPLPRWVPWCSTARVPADIPSRRTTLSAPHDRCTPYGGAHVPRRTLAWESALKKENGLPRRFAPRNDKACRGRRPRRPIVGSHVSVRPPADDGVLSVRQGGLTQAGWKRFRPGGEIFRPADGKPPMAYRVYVEAG